MQVDRSLLRWLDIPVLRTLEGVLTGVHRQRRTGEGMELEEVRAYQPGDEVRRIEWNSTARLGEPYVRLPVDERDVTLWLLVDLSPSMAFGTVRQRKCDLASTLAVSLGYVALRRGDSLGAMVFSGRERQPHSSDRGRSARSIPLVLPPATTRRQLVQLAAVLSRPPRPINLTWSAFLQFAQRAMPRRSLVYVISDFLSDDQWEETVRHLAQRHEVNLVRVVDPREVELPDVGVISVRDAETGDVAWVDTGQQAVRAAYHAAAVDRRQRLHTLARGLGIDVLELSTAEPLLEPLLRFQALKQWRRPCTLPTRSP
ncbi:MAG TPA: DUF58 domain-containing protein [Chloroflexota bacterium]